MSITITIIITTSTPSVSAASSRCHGRHSPRGLAGCGTAQGDDLLRVKGTLNLIGESAPVVVHGVHHIFHPPVVLEAWPDSDHRSTIAFIARGIERAELEASFLEHVVVRSALLRQEAT